MAFDDIIIYMTKNTNPAVQFMNASHNHVLHYMLYPRMKLLAHTPKMTFLLT